MSYWDRIVILVFLLFSQEHQHDVILFRYISWPENDVPENPQSFVNFLLEAKKANQERGDSTLVVLCR